MAQFGNGVTWQFDATKKLAETPTYGTAIGEITAVNLSGPTTDLLDSTVHGDAWRTRVSGLKDGGTAAITVRFEVDNVTHKAVRDAVGVLCAHKFTFPLAVSTNLTPFSWANDAIIQNYSVSAPHDGIMEMTVNLQLSGAPTFVEEAAL
jgi:predicted secreted protein